MLDSKLTSISPNVPNKDPEKKRATDRKAQRKRNGYKRGNRPEIFASISSATLETLNSTERFIIEHYYRDGQSCAAIAKHFNCSRQAVGERKKKIDKKLGI